MTRSSRKRCTFAASLVLLCAFAVAFTGDLVHTDDGCQVEIHCLACQRVLVSVGVASLAAPWCPSIAVVGRIVAIDPLPTREADSPATASRAPPLA
jgi:hypothetical protein